MDIRKIICNIYYTSTNSCARYNYDMILYASKENLKNPGYHYIVYTIIK